MFQNSLKFAGGGTSLVIINTPKAKHIFNKIKYKIIYKRIDYDMACLYNHFENVRENPNRNKFFKMIKNGKITEDNIIEAMNRYLIPSIPKRIIRKIKCICDNIKKKVQKS